MSDKIERYNDIAIELAKLAPIFAKGDDHDAELEAAKTIRTLRQLIERLRRLLDGDEAPAMFLKREDVARLGRDELAFVVDSFWEWYNEEGCPCDKCDDYFCRYCQKQKEEADADLADGEMEPEDYNHLAKNGFYDGMCGDTQEGCWASYYLWCYRNGVNPLNGKKEAK